MSGNRNKNHSRPFSKNSGGQNAGRGKKSSGPNDRYWIYGRHAVFSALDAGRKIYRLWTAEPLKQSPEDAVVEIKKAEDIAAVLPREAVHQGIAAEIAKLPEKDLQDIDLDAITRVALLDQVTDPHNAGAILRSAAAFGVGAVIVPRHGSVSETATMAKSASGALDIVPFVTVNNLAGAIEELKDKGFWIIGMDGEAETDIATMPDYDKVALVLGSEGKGMRRLTGELCDLLVKIPISTKMESLNVSNAAAVAFYALSVKPKG